MKLIIAPEAKVELSGAAAYYRLKSPSAAVNFRREVKSVMARIRAKPQQFPFISTTVRVLGVIHASRDPLLWQSR